MVRDGRVKEALAHAALDQIYVARAPLVIVVVSDTRRSARRYGERGVNFYSIIDGSFAAMLILLAAVNEGLGACFVAAFHDREVQQVLGLPSAVRPIGIISIGYCAKDPRSSRAGPKHAPSIVPGMGASSLSYSLQALFGSAVCNACGVRWG